MKSISASIFLPGPQRAPSPPPTSVSSTSCVHCIVQDTEKNQRWITQLYGTSQWHPMTSRWLWDVISGATHTAVHLCLQHMVTWTGSLFASQEASSPTPPHLFSNAWVFLKETWMNYRYLKCKYPIFETTQWRVLPLIHNYDQHLSREFLF